MIQLSKGINNAKGAKVILAGVAGIGKTTLANQASGAITIDVENGSSLLDITRTPVPETYEDAINYLRDLYTNAETYGLKTLVIDTIDKLESLAISQMLQEDPKHPATIEQYAGGYGKGYTAIAQKMEKLTAILDKFTEKGINVVLVAHDKIVHLDNPELLAPYDTYSINVTKQTRPILIAWADAVLYMARQVTQIQASSGKSKAVRAERVIITESTPAYPDTKNRFGLVGTVPAEYEAVKMIFERS